MTAPRTVFSLLFVLVALVSGCAAQAGEPPVSGGEGGAALSGRPYFELFQGGNGAHYFHLSAANHEIVLASQAYDSRTAALNGVLSVLDNVETSARYKIEIAADGSYYFTLRARNGSVIGTSETYATRSGAESGVAAVIRNVGSYLDWQADRTGARFELQTGVDGRFYFNLHAKNGEIVLSSQGYTDEAAALNATFSVAESGLDAARYDVRPSADGGYYFNLLAPNGQVIGTSEVYTSRASAERARDGIIALLPEVELL